MTARLILPIFRDLPFSVSSSTREESQVQIPYRPFLPSQQLPLIHDCADGVNPDHEDAHALRSYANGHAVVFNVLRSDAQRDLKDAAFTQGNEAADGIPAPLPVLRIDEIDFIAGRELPPEPNVGAQRS